MWPFGGPVGEINVNDYPQGTSHQFRPGPIEYKKPECRCGKSDNDAVLIELIKLFSTFITEVKKMSANTDALKASVAVVDGKLDLLIAKPPVVVSDGVDEMLPEITASVDALGAKIDAALAPAPAPV